MNADEKERVAELRKGGIGYKIIAQILNMNCNTVKSYCHRNGLSESALKKEPQFQVITGGIPKICKSCGKPFVQYPGHREKIFCSSACRIKWWNTHLNQVKRKNMNDYKCPICGKQYSAYENRHRKYCSHECYIAARYGVHWTD